MRRRFQRIAGDWYPGTVPGNTSFDATAHVASSFVFRFCRSQRPEAVTLAPAAALYDGASLILGPDARLHLGEYALIAGGTVFCEAELEVGAYSMVAWESVIMDSYLLPMDPRQRQARLEAAAAHPDRALPPSGTVRPICIGRNVWISFGACILPGVTIGEGAVIGARAVVVEDVPPFTLVAGNPARVVRRLEPDETSSAARSQAVAGAGERPPAQMAHGG